MRKNRFIINEDGNATLTKYRMDQTSYKVPVFVKLDDKRYYITNIGIDAFETGNLRNLSFAPGSHIKSIDNYAFRESLINSLAIPPSLKYIGEDNFMYLKNITVDERNATYVSNNDAEIYKRHALMLIKVLNKNIHIIRESTCKLCGGAFLLNKKITSINIPASIEVIGRDAFCYCINLSRVTFMNHSKLRIIGSSAFLSCEIKKIKIPSSVEVIKEEAFKSTKLEIVVFCNGSKLSAIETSAFAWTNIRYIDFPRSLEIIESEAFLMSDPIENISFPDDSELRIADNAFNHKTAIRCPIRLESILCNKH